MTDIETGQFALQVFHDALMESNSNIPPDMPTFLDGLRRAYFPRDPSEAWEGYENWKKIYYPKSSPAAFNQFVEGLGLAINQADFSTSKITHAMQVLGSNGSVPGNQNAYFSAIQNEAQIFEFYPALKFVVAESAKDIAAGAQKIGENIIGLGDTILKYKNYILIGALLVVGLGLYARIGGKSAVSGLIRKNPKKGKKDWKVGSKVQSLLFHKAFFDEDQAQDWARKHKFSWKHVEEGKNYWRLRQHSPRFFNDFRTIGFTEGVKAVIGPPKKHA